MSCHRRYMQSYFTNPVIIFMLTLWAGLWPRSPYMNAFWHFPLPPFLFVVPTKPFFSTKIQLTMASIHRVPREVLLQIFNNVDYKKSLMNCIFVCKNWRDPAAEANYEKSLWKHSNWTRSRHCLKSIFLLMTTILINCDGQRHW